MNQKYLDLFKFFPSPIIHSLIIDEYYELVHHCCPADGWDTHCLVPASITPI
jgi:hypothetical protein